MRHACLTVQELRVRAVEIAMQQPLETANGSFATWPVALLDLRTREGIVGHAYLGCFRPMALAPLVQLLRSLGELACGQPVRPHDLRRRLKAATRLVGTQGLLGSAIALVEIAAWDAVAKAAGMPLATLLGAGPTPLPVYKTIVAMEVDKARQLASNAKVAGYGGVKLKLGAPTAEQDLQLLRAVRAEVGPSFPIMADYNQALTVPEAIRRIRTLDDEGLVWIEEPTSAENAQGHASIAARVRTPVQLGENWASLSEASASLCLQASAYAMPDLVKIGGVSAWLDAACLANASGVPVSSHAFTDICAHLLPATANPHWVEHVGLADSIFMNAVVPRDGTYTASEKPGLGLEWNEAEIAKCLVR